MTWRLVLMKKEHTKFLLLNFWLDEVFQLHSSDVTLLIEDMAKLFCLRSKNGISISIISLRGNNVDVGMEKK